MFGKGKTLKCYEIDFGLGVDCEEEVCVEVLAMRSIKSGHREYEKHKLVFLSKNETTKEIRKHLEKVFPGSKYKFYDFPNKIIVE